MFIDKTRYFSVSGAALELFKLGLLDAEAQRLLGDEQFFWWGKWWLSFEL